MQLKAWRHDGPFFATLCTTVAEAESNSTFGMLHATNCILRHPPKKFCCVQPCKKLCTVCLSLRPSAARKKASFRLTEILKKVKRKSNLLIPFSKIGH